MLSLFNTISTYIHKAQSAVCAQKHTTVTHSTMSCTLSELKEIELMVHFNDTNNYDDLVFMSVDLTLKHIDNTQMVNMHTEFTHKDLVSHEFLNAIDILSNIIIIQCVYDNFSLLSAVKQLSVSHTFRGYTQECAQAYELSKGLKAKLHAAQKYSMNKKYKGKTVRALDVLKQETHCIKATLYPRKQHKNNGILQLSSATTINSVVHSVHSYDRDNNVYSFISVYDVHKDCNTFNIAYTVHYDLKDYSMFMYTLSNMCTHIIKRFDYFAYKKAHMFKTHTQITT